jgi:hypothetical protein
MSEFNPSGHRQGGQLPPQQQPGTKPIPSTDEVMEVVQSAWGQQVRAELSGGGSSGNINSNININININNNNNNNNNNNASTSLGPPQQRQSISFSMKAPEKKNPPPKLAAFSNTMEESEEGTTQPWQPQLSEKTSTTLHQIAAQFSPELSEAIKRGYPQGFASLNDFMDATRPLKNACRYWDGLAEITVVGSSVTNSRFADKKDGKKALGKFDDTSDYDLGVVSDFMYQKAVSLGARDAGDHTYALTVNRDSGVLSGLKLLDQMIALEKLCGKHKISLMIYQDSTKGKVTLTRADTPPPSRRKMDDDNRNKTNNNNYNNNSNKMEDK